MYSFVYLCVFYTLEFTMQGKWVDSGATRPNSTFNRRKVMRGRLAWAHGSRSTGMPTSALIGSVARLTRIPVRLSASHSL